MSVYTPIVLAGVFDGDEVDENFDRFQTATCSLNSINFAATTDLGFKHFHPGASSETFVENGEPKTMIFNTFVATSQAGSSPIPYPNDRIPRTYHPVSDTEVVFVAKADGRAVVNSYVDLHRPKALWTLAAIDVHLQAGVKLGMVEGVDNPVNWSDASTALTAGGTRNIAWTSGELSDERVGQTVRARGQFDITKGERYSVWLTVDLLVLPINSLNGVITHNNSAATTFALVNDPFYFPEGFFCVSIYGSSRQTSVTCIYE